MAGSISAAVDFLRFLHSLRSRRFDLVLDLQGLFRSGFISFCSGAVARIGFAHARELAPIFYNHRITIPHRKEHVLDSYWRFARYLGFGQAPKRFFILIEADIEEQARDLLLENQLNKEHTYLVMLIGATSAAKRWPAERFAALADKVQNRYDMKIVLLGTGSDEKIVAQQVAETADRETINLVDKTSLMQAVAIIKSARLVVGNDSGTLHIAAALSVPLVGIYGPTDPVVVGPYGQSDGVVQAGLGQPRIQRYSEKPEHRIDNITVNEVLQTIHKKLKL